MLSVSGSSCICRFIFLIVLRFSWRHSPLCASVCFYPLGVKTRELDQACPLSPLQIRLPIFCGGYPLRSDTPPTPLRSSFVLYACMVYMSVYGAMSKIYICDANWMSLGMAPQSGCVLVRDRDTEGGEPEQEQRDGYPSHSLCRSLLCIPSFAPQLARFFYFLPAFALM